MTDKAELAARFDRVLSALRAVIATETALDPAWEETKKGVGGAFADALFSRSEARRAFEDETPTMDALIINLKDNRYEDSSWPTDGADDAQMLRSVWHFIHDTIGARKPFAPDDLSMMRNLAAALERAREKLASRDTPDDAQKPSWDRIKGKLSFDGETVRTIRRIGAASNVVRVRNACQRPIAGDQSARQLWRREFDRRCNKSQMPRKSGNRSVDDHLASSAYGSTVHSGDKATACDA